MVAAHRFLSIVNFWATVAYRMLRFRTVVLMVTFEAIGYEAVRPTGAVYARFILTAVMLGLLYMSSTCFNDVADEEVDKVNLPHDASRPLVTTKTTPRQLRRLGVVAILGACLAAFLVSPTYLGFVMAAVLLSLAYSLPPVRLSYRGILASLSLSTSYVVVPFLAGARLQGSLNHRSLYILLAMYVCFMGRILLKDFRDYEGDKQFGKRNFLVRHGPRATCQVAGAAWLLGDLIFIMALARQFPLVIGLVQPLIGIILYQLYRLARENNYRRQLLEITVIGRAGNAITLGLLCALTLQAFNYSALQKRSIIVSVTTLIALTAVASWRETSQPSNSPKLS